VTASSRYISSQLRINSCSNYCWLSASVQRLLAYLLYVSSTSFLLYFRLKCLRDNVLCLHKSALMDHGVFKTLAIFYHLQVLDDAYFNEQKHKQRQQETSTKVQGPLWWQQFRKVVHGLLVDNRMCYMHLARWAIAKNRAIFTFMVLDQRRLFWLSMCGEGDCFIHYFNMPDCLTNLVFYNWACNNVSHWFHNFAFSRWSRFWLWFLVKRPIVQ